MIKRKYPLEKVPLDERPYPIEGFALRRDGSVWMMRRYRGIEIQHGFDDASSWFFWIGDSALRERTLTKACDRIDEYANRRDGQLRRHEARRKAEARQAERPVEVEFAPAAGSPFFVEAIQGEDGPVVLPALREIIRACTDIVVLQLLERHGYDMEEMLEHLALAQRLHRRLADMIGTNPDVYDHEPKLRAAEAEWAAAEGAAAP